MTSQSETPQPERPERLERPTLAPGDRIPDFIRCDHTGQPQALYEYPKGRVMVLLAFTQVPKPSNPLLQRISEQFGSNPDLCVVAVVPQAVADNKTLWAQLDLQFPLWADEGAVVQTLCEGAGKSLFRILVLDPNLRIRTVLSEKKGKVDLDRLCRDLEGAIAPLQSSEPPRQIHRAAPILLVEDILNAQICRKLIQTHARGKTFASGMARVIEGQTVMQPEADLKKRIDHIVEDPALTGTLTNLLSRRLLPEMKKAFHFQPRGLENFKIVRYDSSSQGFFSLHRDNNSKDTARRKFALTLNLNSPAAYKGGALRFPEYGPHLYRPQAGQALVFSCSHLHEVTPVTQGTRYGLINFFLI